MDKLESDILHAFGLAKVTDAKIIAGHINRSVSETLQGLERLEAQGKVASDGKGDDRVWRRL